MRIVALEEHFKPDGFARNMDRAVLASRGWTEAGPHLSSRAVIDRLREAGPERIADMDRAGITLQVLSLGGSGAELLAGDDAVREARGFNDRIHAIAHEHPGRFAGLAHLPMADPAAAADELERAVRELGLTGAMINGTIDDRFLDDARFEPLLARAEALDVPLYLHPNLPPESVVGAYYDGLPDAARWKLAGPGFGWHVETGLHVVRLAVSGALDRHPGLKLVVGHMGECLPFMIDRLDDIFADFASANLHRGLGQTIRDHVWITTSGFFSLAPFMAALMTFGEDRILFSVDYPHSANSVGAEFLRRLPVSEQARRKIAHGNADRLLRLARD